jgi:hypothetical protein
VPEIIDPVFAKTSQNARFLLSENERFGLVLVKTGSINSGTGLKFLRQHTCNFTLKLILQGTYHPRDASYKERKLPEETYRDGTYGDASSRYRV